MIEHTREWADKAEEDWRAVQALQMLDPPPCAIVCFHCQQVAEKYLGAVLVEQDIPFPKTHDLSTLVNLQNPAIKHFDPRALDLDALTDMSVQVRYPGVVANPGQMEWAIELALWVRDLSRQVLLIAEEEGNGPIPTEG